jgi:hypothetical protein
VRLLLWYWLVNFFLFAGVALGAQPSRPARCGPLADQLLRCPRFGFTYNVPFGWVDRTSDMQDNGQDPQPRSGESPTNDDQAEAEPDRRQPASSAGAETLLAVFERPPGAPGETINSAVVIAAEPAANYHGLKTAADYFGAITELSEHRGFKVINEPYLFSIGARQLARGDFSKQRNQLTMWQSSLVMIDRGEIVSFNFVAGSQEELEELIGGLSFPAQAQAPRHR